LENDIKADPIMSEMYFKDGKLISEGDLVVNFRLARTLELLVNKENIFYIDGEIGIEMIDDLSDPQTVSLSFKNFIVLFNIKSLISHAKKKQKEQHLTSEDLRSYTVREEAPVMATYNGKLT
jgi:gamma-glutamyltranspeptidase